MVKKDSMEKLEYKTIKTQIGNLKNLPNNVLLSFMDNLTNDFEETKQKLIDLTYHIDNVEEDYNKILKGYQSRINE